MQQLLEQIQSVFGSLSQAQKSVGSFVLENYQQIPFLSVTSLAREIGVSETTVIKFCVQLGFDGFGSFKRVITDYVQNGMTMYNNLETRSEGLEKNDTLDKVMARDMNNIQATLSNPMNRSNFEPFLEYIEKAKTVYVLGFRTAATLAQHMAMALEQQGRKAHAIIPGLGEYVDKLCEVTPEDLVIVVTFSRYSSEVVKSVDYLKREGVPCVLITDTLANPLYDKADLVFRCETKSYSYIASYVACMALMNALFTATSLNRKAAAKAHLKKLEDLFKEFDTFYI